MDATSLDAFGSGGFASKTVLALVGQPWSYLRLKAYSFIWLCEGAYGDYRGSALDGQHTGPNSLIDTRPRTRASQEPIG